MPSTRGGWTRLSKSAGLSTLAARLKRNLHLIRQPLDYNVQERQSASGLGYESHTYKRYILY
ncbi:hypothetical protein CGRA01v4_09064 [Colletotrichum graminicola]|nr:hypothetical protein CGRA01v4_09064 [Colletotrichum graminicola]